MQAAASGRTVVRLKGGCPSVFSRVRWQAEGRREGHCCAHPGGARPEGTISRHLGRLHAEGSTTPAPWHPQVHSELAALRAAGIPYEIVPGISSVQAAPLAAGGLPCRPCAWPLPYTRPTDTRSKMIVESVHNHCPIACS